MNQEKISIIVVLRASLLQNRGNDQGVSLSGKVPVQPNPDRKLGEALKLAQDNGVEIFFCTIADEENAKAMLAAHGMEEINIDANHLIKDLPTNDRMATFLENKGKCLENTVLILAEPAQIVSARRAGMSVLQADGEADLEELNTLLSEAGYKGPALKR